MDEIFDTFIGKQIKATYRDGTQFKIAKGKLELASKGFLKVNGKLGIIIINQNTIEKLALMKSS